MNLLKNHFSENSYYVYAPKKAKDKLDIHPEVILKHPSRYQIPALWRSYGIVKDLKRDQVSLYHGLTNELPYGISASKISSVVTIHDLIFLRFPKFYPIIDRAIYRYKCEYACSHATRIIAVSEQTKHDIIKYFKIDEDKIDVIYQSCNLVFQRRESEDLKKSVSIKYNLPENYILQVGTVEERKNVLLTVKALRNVPDNVKLVVIGRHTEYTKDVQQYINRFKLENRVIFLKRVPVADLPSIYQQAQIFVYPSEFEGFGIPILEALYSGIPVIAASGSCLEEAGGPHSCYVHPKDDVQLSWTINSILNSPELRKAMIENGLEYVKNFEEGKLAEQLMNVYKKVLNHA